MGGDSRSKVHAISYPDTFTRPHRFIDYQNEKCASNTCSNNRCTIDNSRNEKYEKKRASLFNVSERTGPRSTVSRDNVKWFGMKLIKTTDWKKGDAQGDEYKFSWEHNPSKESCFRRGMEQYQSDNTSGAVTYDTQTKECYLEKNIPTTNWYKPKPNENYITARLDCDTNLCVTGIEQGGMVLMGIAFVWVTLTTTRPGSNLALALSGRAKLSLQGPIYGTICCYRNTTNNHASTSVENTTKRKSQNVSTRTVSMPVLGCGKMEKAHARSCRMHKGIL